MGKQECAEHETFAPTRLKFCFPITSMTPSLCSVRPTAPKAGIPFPLPLHRSSGIFSNSICTAMQRTSREGENGFQELQPKFAFAKRAMALKAAFTTSSKGRGWTHMWCRVHQPQCGSPELRHSPQVVYCSQDSTGTRDTCKASKHAGLTFGNIQRGSKKV